MNYDKNTIEFIQPKVHRLFRDLTGQTFNRLTVIGWGKVPTNARPLWICQCVCGNITAVRTRRLETGYVQSCGCLARELSIQRNTIYTTTDLPYSKQLKWAWSAMKKRCYNTTSNPKWERYGGRGIQVCNGWRYSFHNFITDMGEPPTSKHSLDRKDLDGHYSCGHCLHCIENGWPMNCQWADSFQQMNNTSRNHFVTINNRTMTVAQWIREIGIPKHVFYTRYCQQGMSDIEALTTPLSSRQRAF